MHNKTTRRSNVAALLGLLAVATLSSSLSADEISIAKYTQEGQVHFEKQVLPILRRKCVACHNSTDAESDLVLESPQTIAKGGSEGKVVLPEKAEESRLLVLAAHRDDPVMPPEDNDVGAKNLTSEELGLLKLWIEQGAKGEVTGLVEKIEWQPLPKGVNPIYTVAVSDDGQYAAAGRANQIAIYHLPSKREVARLTDPELLKGGTYSKPGVAHLDLVQSLAFAPAGDLVASGGFRTVKLWRRIKNAKKREIKGIDAMPRSMATSVDGSHLAIGQESGSIKVLDLDSGELVATLNGHSGPVTALGFTPDGKLVSGGTDKSFRRWSIPEAKETTPAVETPAEVLSIVVVGDGKLIATGGSDNKIRTWPMDAVSKEGEAPKPIKEFNGCSGPVTSLTTLDTKGARFVSGSADGSVRIWDANGGNQIRQMAHGGPVESVAVRPDGKRIASVSRNHSLKLWNADNGQPVKEVKGDFRTYLRAAALTRAVELAKKKVGQAKKDLEEANKRKKSEEDNAKKAEDNRKKAEEDMKKKVEAAKKPVADKEMAEKALADAIAGKATAEAAKKAADESFANADAELKKKQAELNVADKALAAAIEKAKKAKQKLAAALAAANKQADNEELTKAVTVAETESKAADGEQTKASETKAAGAKGVADATAARKTSEDAKKAADKGLADIETKRKQAEDQSKKLAAPAKKAMDEKTAAERAFQAAERGVKRAMESVKKAANNVPVVEAVVKQSEETQKAHETSLEAAKKATTDNEKPFFAVAFSRDGQTIAAVGDGQQVCTFDGDTGAALDCLSGQNAPLKFVGFNAGNDVVSVGDDRSIVVWNGSMDWKLERVIGDIESKDLADRVIALDFSSDGKMLATGSGEPSRSGQIKIWNVADGSLLREVKEPHSDTVFGLEFSPDDTLIASCAADRFVKVFTVADGKLVRPFEGHTHHVLGVSWSADGRTLASSGADKVIKVWDSRTGDQKKTIAGFNKEVTSIRFISTKDEFVASCGDKSVQMKRADGGNIRSLPGGQDFMYSVGVSGDGQMIVAGGQDSVVRVWSADGKAVATFESSP